MHPENSAFTFIKKKKSSALSDEQWCHRDEEDLKLLNNLFIYIVSSDIFKTYSYFLFEERS